MALKSIKIGKLDIEDLEQVLRIQEIITRNKIRSPKYILMQWLFTKMHFFLDTFLQYSYIVITF
jgi:hypothetical protein